jgi:type IV pilus assembly protein PilN
MQVIEKLQRSRSEVVHLFDEIARTMPDGTYLTSFKQEGKHLKFEGVAQSSTRVSTFMRNISASQWMKDPELEVVESKPGATVGNSFVLDAGEIVAAGDEDDDAAAKPKQRIRSGGAK